MPATTSSRRTPLEDLEVWLGRKGRKPSVAGPGRWDFTFVNGQPFPAHAQTDGDWIVIDLTIDRMTPWAAMSVNADLFGARVIGASTPRGSDPRVRSELRLEASTPLSERLLRAEVALQDSLLILEAEVCSGRKRVARAPEPPEAAELRERFETDGWSTRERASGGLAVDLAVAGPEVWADVRASARGGVTVSIPTMRRPVPSGIRRVAVGRYLLCAASRLRHVRPTARSGGDVRLEVDVPDFASSSDIEARLGGLALARARLGRGAEILSQSEELASTYAALSSDDPAP